MGEVLVYQLIIARYIDTDILSTDIRTKSHSVITEISQCNDERQKEISPCNDGRNLTVLSLVVAGAPRLTSTARLSRSRA